MKILHVITGLRRAAGTTVFCARVAEACAQAGHEVAIAVPVQYPENDEVPEGVPVVTWKLGEGLPFRPEIIHVHGLWMPWLHRAQVWARREHIPVVLSPHGMLAPWAMAHKRWKKVLPWVLYQRPNPYDGGAGDAVGPGAGISQSGRRGAVGYRFARRPRFA